jgi:hypothetical protein
MNYKIMNMAQKYLTGILMVCCFLISSIPIYAQNNKLQWLDGEWNGVGYQVDNNSTWSIKLTVNSTTNTFHIEYPSLSCGGNWKLDSFDENKAQFTEVLNGGLNGCVSNSIMILTRVNEKHISFSCFMPVVNSCNKDAVISSYATLIRIETSRNK